MEDKNLKIVFLDIDGVLQPHGSQERFDHIIRDNDNEFTCKPSLYNRLQYLHQIDYRQYNPYDVAAVYFDWDKTAIALLKVVLEYAQAKIVLSSDWRMDGFQRMKDFFTIYGLENYLIDFTKFHTDIDKDFINKIEQEDREKNGEKSYVEYRSIEILEWLSRHPDVTKWAAVDDLSLKGIEAHFVRTHSRFEAEHAIQCLRLLID